MSVRRVKLRRGTHTQNDAFAGAIGEITVDTTNSSIRVHDGTTNGGRETLRADLDNLGSNVLSAGQVVSFLDSAGNATVRLRGVEEPAESSDVATKGYVDSGGASSIEIGSLSNVTLGVDGGTEDALSDADFLIFNTDSDGSTGANQFRNKPISGDLNINNEGVATLQSGAITSAKIDIINNSAISNAKLTNSTVTIGATSVALGATETAFTGLTGLDFTNGNVSIGATVTKDGSNNPHTITLGGTGSKVVITGDLLISGTATTVNTTTLEVKDPVIRLNHSVAGGANSNDIGILMERGNSGNDAILYFDDSASAFRFGLTTEAHTASDFTTGNTTDADLSLKDLTASGEVNVTGLASLDGGINVNDDFVVNTDGGITATNDVSSFKSGSSIGDITISDGSIVCGGAQISFGSENLTTSGNISATGTGTLSVAGLSTLTGGATLGADSTLSINKKSTESDKLIILNADTGTGQGQNAVIAVDMGDTYSTITWQHDETTWAFSHNLSVSTDVTVGQDLIITRNGFVNAELTVKDTLFIQSQPDDDFGIVFNSDRGAQNKSSDFDVKLITVEAGSGNADEGYIFWDDVNSTFAVNGGKLHSNTDFSVGTAVGTNKFTVAQASGNTAIAGTLAVTGVTTLGANLDVGDFNIVNVGSLSADILKSDDGSNLNILLDANKPSALTIGTSADTDGFATFVTTTSAHKIQFHEITELPASSKIANLTFASGQITSASGETSFGGNELKADSMTCTGSSGGFTASSTSTSSFGVGSFSGLLSPNGGINVSSGAFTVAHTSGNIATNGTFAVNTDKFTVSTAGVVSIAGATTFADALNIKDGISDGITFRSDIASNGSAGDATLIRVNDGGAGPAYKTIKWDTNPGVFDFSHALNSTGNLTVGAVGSTKYTVVSSTGATTQAGRLNIQASDLSNASQSAMLVLNSDVGTSQERDAIIEVERGDETNASIKWDETNGHWALSNALKSTGNFIVGANKFNVTASSGNTAIAGTLAVTSTLAVTGVTTLGDTLNLDDTCGGIVFNSNDTNAGDNADATLLTVERGTDTNAIISWDEDPGEFNLNPQGSLHIQGKAGVSGNALTIGDTTSAGTTTAKITTGGMLTVSSADFSSGGLTQVGNVSGVGSIALDSITDQTGDGMVISLADNQPSALSITESTNEYLVFVTTDSSEEIQFKKDVLHNEPVAFSKATTHGGIVNLKYDATASLIVANSDRTGSGQDADATLIEVERGELTNAKFKWDQSNASFAFDTKLVSQADLHIGATLGSQKVTIASSNGNITTEGILNFPTASQGAIVFNSDLAGGSAPNVNDDFGITVNRGSGTNAIFHWDEGELSWLFNNAGKVQINNDLIVDSGSTDAITISDGSISCTSGSITFGASNLQITSDTGEISFDNDNITTTGTLTAGATTLESLTVTGSVSMDNAGNIGDVADIALTTISPKTNDITVNVGDGRASAFHIQQGDANEDYLTINSLAETITLHQATTLTSNLNFTTANAGAITFNSDLAGGVAPASTDDFGLTVNRGSATDAKFFWDESETNWEFADVGNVKILGNLTVDSTLAFTTGSITDTTGAISFGDENLSTTGTLGAGVTTVTSLNVTGEGLTAITLNSDQTGTPSHTVGISIERGDSANATLAYNETGSLWQADRGDGNGAQNILLQNDTLFTLKTDTTGTAGQYNFTQGASPAILTLNNTDNNIDITNSSNVVSIKLDDDVSIVQDLEVGNDLDVGTDLDVGADLTVAGTIKGTGTVVKFKDPMIQLGLNATSPQTNNIGFYCKYEDSSSSDVFAGFLYQPNGSDTGTYKLFDRHATNISDSDTTATIADTALATLDCNGVRILGKPTTSTNESTSSGNFTSNTHSVSVTVTTNGALGNGARKGTSITVSNTLCKATSVIMGTASAHVDVHPHTVADGSFQFTYTNQSGSPIADGSNITFNFVIL